MRRPALTILSLCCTVLEIPILAHAAMRCEVSVAVDLPPQSDLSTISVVVDYSSTYGTFVESGSRVACVPMNAETSLVREDQCSPDTLCYTGAARFLVLVGASAAPNGLKPELARCSFVTDPGREPTPDSFRVTTLAGTRPNETDDIDPLPTASVSSVECSPID